MSEIDGLIKVLEGIYLSDPPHAYDNMAKFILNSMKEQQEDCAKIHEADARDILDLTRKLEEADEKIYAFEYVLGIGPLTEIANLKKSLAEAEKPKICPTCFKEDAGVCTEDFEIVKHKLSEAQALAEQRGKQLDALLAHCDKEGGECSECSKIICPHKDEMHFHHDGCPSCEYEYQKALRERKP